MDAKLLFWTWAWLNLALVLGLALLGIRRIREGALRAHRRLLFVASFLVVFFLVAYVGKLFFLGREQLELWSESYVQVLRLHELCILFMCTAGGIAIYLSLRLGLPDPPEPPPHRLLRLHRRSGWVSLSFGFLAIVSAAYVLWGMYQRIA